MDRKLCLRRGFLRYSLRNYDRLTASEIKCHLLSFIIDRLCCS